jgi:hypothetical protein
MKESHIMNHITPGHVRAFKKCCPRRSMRTSRCGVASSTANPGVAIVALDEVGENKIAVMPLFVSITPNMELVFPGERDSAGAGGGPKNPREVVKLNKGLTTHCPRPAPS